MIVVQLIGGLGNQMFQYALGRSLADKNNSKLELDLSWFGNIENVNTKRQYELDCYPITAKLTDATKLKIIEPGQQAANHILLGRLFGQNPLTVYNEPDASFHAEILNLTDSIYLKGYWQNEKYFISIRSKLLKEFIPKSLSGYSKSMTEKIRSRPSVSLHIRRSDYAVNPLTNKFHGLTPIEYYVQALDYILGKIADPLISVFSDDIKWCRDNLPFAKEAEFINGNPADRGCEDMYLMRLCNHNIIANSSFSWWGAWLNENPDKIIIAPKMWFRDKKADKEIDNIPKAWIRL